MIRPLLVIASCLALAATVRSQTDEQSRAATQERGAKIREHQSREPSKEAAERKIRSLVRLRAEGVPLLEDLPVIEDSKEAKTRSTEEIAKRAIAVCLTAAKGEGVDQATLDSLVRQYGADAFFSPKEASFIRNPNPSPEERAKYSWRYEDYWVLLWALGYVDTLDRPEVQCDVPRSIRFLKSRTTQQFIADAKPRPLATILDEADLIYRYDWATTNARVKSQLSPAKLDGEIVQERHYALNWLIGYMDQAWDDISIDT